MVCVYGFINAQSKVFGAAQKYVRFYVILAGAIYR